MLSRHSLAEMGIKDCGLYKVKAYAAQDQQSSYLQVFKKTKSEIKILITKESEPQLWPYMDKAVNAEILVTNIQSPYFAFAELRKIKNRVPDPLRPNRDGEISIIEKRNCAQSNKEGFRK